MKWHSCRLESIQAEMQHTRTKTQTANFIYLKNENNKLYKPVGQNAWLRRQSLKKKSAAVAYVENEPQQNLCMGTFSVKLCSPCLVIVLIWYL